MRAFLPVASAAALLALPALACAQTAQTTDSSSMFYGGAGYALHDYKGSDLGTVQGRIGARVLPNFAIEGEVGGGVKGDKSDGAIVDSSSKITRQGAIYGVGLLPVSPNTDVFARVGYGATQVKSHFNALGVTGSDKDTIKSVNYGVGAQHFFDGVNGIRADYTRADATRGDRDANVWALGYVRRF